MVRRGPTRRAGAASRNRTTVGRPSLNIHPDPVFFDMDHTLINNDCDVSILIGMLPHGDLSGSPQIGV